MVGRKRILLPTSGQFPSRPPTPTYSTHPCEMDSIYNPDDSKLTADWFGEIGEATGCEQAWSAFRMGVVQCTAASTIGLLRKARDNDIDAGLNASKLSVGYKDALCEYLTAKSAPPFAFTSPIGTSVARETSNRGHAPSSAMSQKKFDSQRERPPLGRELGPEMLGKDPTGIGRGRPRTPWCTKVVQ